MRANESDTADLTDQPANKAPRNGGLSERAPLLRRAKTGQRAIRRSPGVAAAAEPRARGAVVGGRLIAMREPLVHARGFEVRRRRDRRGTLAGPANRVLEL